MAKKKKTSERSDLMDITSYLRDNGDGIASGLHGMLFDLFRQEIMTESEWRETISRMITHRV